MSLDNRGLLVLQFALSLAAWSAIGFGLVRPALLRLDPHRALRWLVAPQMLRHLGMSVLAAGVAGPGLSPRFAEWVATGDLITSVLAIAAFGALSGPRRLGIAIAWLATLIGLADLLHNLSLGMRLGAPDHLGSAWFIVAMIVPLMLVAHVLAADQLLRHRRRIKGTS